MGLRGSSGNSVEDEDFGFGMELVDELHALNVLAPDIDGKFVRHELPAGGVFPKESAGFALQVEGAKDIAGGAVEEAGDGAEDFPLRAFAAAGSAEEED